MCALSNSSVNLIFLLVQSMWNSCGCFWLFVLAVTIFSFSLSVKVIQFWSNGIYYFNGVFPNYSLTMYIYADDVCTVMSADDMLKRTIS